MSFSGDVKNELAGVETQARHCMIAELAAFVMLSGSVEETESGSVLRVRTENEAAARKLFTLLQRAFNIDIALHREKDSRHGGGVFRIGDPDRVRAVLAACGHETVLRKECCKRAFLRGAFLAAGSVSDPEKSYHLEVVCPDRATAAAVRDAMKETGLTPRIVLRKKNHVVYLKEGDQIVALLGAMGASISFLNIENVRVLKEMRGSVNRRVNCETANLNKTVVSAVRQIEEIRFIRDNGGFGELTPQLREMAEIRLAHPEAPLTELGSFLNPRIGKSGVNHRLRKLCAYAEDLRRRTETS